MLNFCQNCGSKELLKQNQTLTTCQNCQYQIYNNPKMTSTTIVIYDNKVLLGRRSIQPEKDKWGYGGGFGEYGENAFETSLRETKEELGIQIKGQHILTCLEHPYMYQDEINSICSVVFVAFISKEQFKCIKPNDDVAEVKFVTLQELENTELAFEPFASKVKESLFEYLGYQSYEKFSMDEARQKIDKIDTGILTLLAKRMKIIAMLGTYKKTQKMEVLDSDHWKSMLIDRMKQADSKDLNTKFIEEVWTLMHYESLVIESKASAIL